MVETPKTEQAVQLSPKAQRINEVAGKLQELLTKNEKALPKNFNQTRFLQNCLAVLADTKDIEECTALSVARAMIKGAYLDLDFFRRECYCIPYMNKDLGKKEANFQTDYKGEIKLCEKYSVRKIKHIYAKVVREGDDLEIGIKDNQPVINFKPLIFNDGKIIGVFAACLYEDGGLIYDTMSIKETESTRANYSKMPNSPAYQKSIGEMYKKIGLRRLTKLIALDFESHEQAEAYEAGGDLDTKKLTAPIIVEIDDPFANQQQTAQDPDAELRKKLQEQFPTEAAWQIDARIKDHKGTT